MHPETTKVAEHMRGFALTVLGRAAYDVTFSEMTRPFAHAMAVTLAAHGAEIAVKARIAEQHPLLIFAQLPKANSTDSQLTIKELLTAGRTLMFSELPERLWATTGYRMQSADRFQEFGALRNQIMHFAVPSQDFSATTLRFLFEVVEPMVNDFWKESIIPYAEEYDEVIAAEGYLPERLQRLDVRPTKLMEEHFGQFEREKQEMERRAKAIHTPRPLPRSGAKSAKSKAR